MNRLKLDFTLNTNVERNAFINKYVSELDFTPTEDELDLMAKYILWGRDPATGLNSVQDGSIELPTKHDEWASTAQHPTESLDGLIEQPAFSESSLKSLTSTHYTARTPKLNRTELRKAAASRPELLAELEDLWRQIDQLDLQINLYELLTGKRTKPVRDKLLQKFSSEEVAAAQQIVSEWKQYQYLKKRHLLVDLRRQQYTIKDSLASPIGYGTPSYTQNDEPYTEEKLVFDADIPILPLGLYNKSWEQNTQIKYDCPPSTWSIDLRSEEVIYKLINSYQDLEESYDESDLESTTKDLLRTFDFYAEQADLTPVYAEVLARKLRHEKNADIAKIVNSKYNKKYTENYISTILTQKVIPKITEQVKFHEMRNQHWNDPTMFKTCITCGRTYLRTADFFVRKARSNDGLNNRCKKCDKKIRDERKMIEYYGGQK